MADNLSLVLFGAPASGKSSLIGALVAAGQTQSAQLGGQLLDVSGGMTELKNQTYQKGPPPTQEELRSYPLTLEPLAAGQGAATNATLTDCSGPAAQTILTAQTALPKDSPLAQALLDADALILLLDAGVPLDRVTLALGQFLRLFQSVRGQRVDIAGLPVYLVLSKCDLIAKPDDTFNRWVQRIEEAKRKLDQHFRTLLKDQGAVAFGRVQLHLWATAVKRPAFADRPAQTEPFGVAELFRQALTSAGEYRGRREHAAGRLSLAVAGIFGLIAALGLGAGILYLTRPSAELTALENQVHRVLPGPTAADRLHEPLDERLRELGQIQESPQFAKLPPKLRDEVLQARREIEQYQKLNKDFLAQVSDPRFATRDEELDQIEKSLKNFILPDDYLADWHDTKLVRRMRQWQLDIQQLRAAAADEEKWLRDQTAAALPLKVQGGLVLAKSLTADQRDAWFKQVQEYLDREPRHKPSERLPVGSSLTFDHVYRMQRVDQARKAWDRAKDGLRDLRKLAQ
jgi:hypothetical protein